MSGYTAAAQLYRAVRNFAQGQPAWADRIVFDVMPDHQWDATKIARIVYGDPDEALTVMAAAGLDGFEFPLKQQRLILPTPAQLLRMKAATGFASNAEDRASSIKTVTDIIEAR